MNRKIKNLWKLIGRDSDGMLVTSPENVRYLCGFSGTEGTLLLSRGASFFLTDGRYTTQARQQVSQCSIVTFTEKWKHLARIVKKLGIRSLGFEARHVTVAFFRELENEAPGLQLKPYAEALDSLRMIKDSGEISMLRTAARIAAQSLQEVLGLMKPGIRELDIATELEYRMKKNGGDGPAFQTIVASGVRSALPHGIATKKRIHRGELLTIDYGVVYQGYCSDETCTFVLGSPSPKQKKIYDLVLRAHDRALKAVMPGQALKNIDAAARTHIARCGYKKYFNHGTGHGIGLCVHEPPVVSYRSTMTARKGMLFTIEPGLYMPGWGGVRIEDMVVVTERGGEVLTPSNKRLRCIEL